MKLKRGKRTNEQRTASAYGSMLFAKRQMDEALEKGDLSLIDLTDDQRVEIAIDFAYRWLESPTKPTMAEEWLEFVNEHGGYKGLCAHARTLTLAAAEHAAENMAALSRDDLS